MCAPVPSSRLCARLTGGLVSCRCLGTTRLLPCHEAASALTPPSTSTQPFSASTAQPGWPGTAREARPSAPPAPHPPLPVQLLGSWYVLAVASSEKGFVAEKATKSIEGVVVSLTPEDKLRVLSSRHR